eukprot:TRINITY_DN3786_c0_g3_i1.p1 TRINITY_DN3786_c0_g3~~TRINITY_DN3786_c0_g3_i1.p1  ORF type:complete len:161 (-),score=20.33 TRINITY_DN3786_c0_g3_i1:109-591(-)
MPRNINHHSVFHPLNPQLTKIKSNHLNKVPLLRNLSHPSPPLPILPFISHSLLLDPMTEAMRLMFPLIAMYTMSREAISSDDSNNSNGLRLVETDEICIGFSSPQNVQSASSSSSSSSSSYNLESRILCIVVADLSMKDNAPHVPPYRHVHNVSGGNLIR